MEFAWKKRLSVGNAFLDTEHKKLIDMVNGVEHAIRTKNSSALPQALNQLLDFVYVHFENEKKIAQAIGFPFAEHEQEHRYVQMELMRMKDELVDNNVRWSASAAEHYSYFLSEWFNEHLTEEVMLMKPMLETYPYDFNHLLETK